MGATATTDTAMVCTTARGPPSPDTDMATTDTTATDTTATTARGLLTPSPATATTATVLTVTATTDTVTATATATSDKKFHSEVVQFRVQYKNKHKKLDHSVLVLN